MKFDVIIMDPPWQFSDKLTMSETKRGAESNYSVMSNEDIKNLDIKSLSKNDGTILCLWVPSSLLELGLECMKTYGFSQKSTYVWVKCKKEKSLLKIFKKLFKKLFKNDLDKFNIFFNDISNYLTSFGMGRLFRASHELAIVGINNKQIYKKLKNKSQRSVCIAENFKHSQKPDDLHKSLELMFTNSEKLEIFARRQYLGWTCVGNEIDGLDIREAIKQLKDA